MSNKMEKQWDALARENVFYSVVSRPDFEDPKCIPIDRFWKSGRDDADSLLARLNLADTQTLTMVELGCGIGRMTQRFAEIFKHVYAIDVSSEMLSLARKHWGHLANVDFVIGSGSDLAPLAKSSVDLVFSYICLQHVTDPRAVLAYVRETSRVLKPGGLAFLQFRTSTNSVIPLL